MKSTLNICLFLNFLVLLACSQDNNIVFQPSSREQFRPAFHFTPETSWMNDPNGMFYLDGEYHLFYQYYPDSTVWGPMHWGHAVSKDLTQWDHLSVALKPDSLGYIFSGSAVVDYQNSAGFGTLKNPPIVAIFTYHDPKKEKEGATDVESQGIAYSLDKGRTWEKYENNPVLPNPGYRDFRDPKVQLFKNNDGTEYWVMTLAVADHIEFYHSTNLIDWSKSGEFGKTVGAHGGVWECPDLIPLKTLSGELKYVLLVSINPGGPQKGSATQYFIGDFQDGVFTPDDTMIRWMDYGPDNYAGVTISNIPEDQNRVVLIGWMSNWLYAQQVPTKSWRSAMTIPRNLSLFDVDGTLLLKSEPISELTQLRKTAYQIDGQSALPTEAAELSVDIANEEPFIIKFKNELGEQLSISKEMGLISIDRTQAGMSSFHPDFPAIHSAPMSWEAKNLRIFLDAHSVEVFVNQGELVMTSLVFPTSPWKEVELSTNLKNAKLFSLEE